MPINKSREDFRFYKIWADMKYRCTNPNCGRFADYGGRGIMYCLEWMCYENFKNDMWESYKKHSLIYGEKQTTLDRIDVNDHYCKSNCRWATYQEQRINVRDKEEYCGYNLVTNQFYNFNNLNEFCRKTGFNRRTINDVIKGKIKTHHNTIFSKINQDNASDIYKELLQKANVLKNNPKYIKLRKEYLANGML